MLYSRRTGRSAARQRTCMGCRGSVVQIHSPRPFDTKTGVDNLYRKFPPTVLF